MIVDTIFEFVNYSLDKGLIKNQDITYMINRICGMLMIENPEKEFERIPTNRIIDDILNDILDYAIENKFIENYNYAKDLFDTLIMDQVTPLPSTVEEKFFSLMKEDPKAATDYFYKLMVNVNYIRDNRNKKNIVFEHPSKYGQIFVSINLSKPEKDPKLIVKAASNSQNKYPKCQLCYENVGYFGRMDHPARNNLRVIPLKVNNEDFYFQYSPYAYFNEHCIVFSKDHVGMKISEETYKRLFDFVEYFPHYFLGSNAGIPICGGSILSHEHYQGGCFTFPIDVCDVRFEKMIDGVKAEYLNWPLDVIRLSSKSREDLLKVANKVTAAWNKYENKAINIVAFDTEKHNAITPIARIVDGTYVLNLVLRNNLTSDEFPYGIYHPAEKLHHIKKENIGLIEVAGLAILPGRLKQELSLLDDILKGKEPESRLSEIEIHREWYNELKQKGTPIDINYEVGEIFVQVLEACQVFKYGTIDDVKAFVDSIK